MHPLRFFRPAFLRLPLPRAAPGCLLLAMLGAIPGCAGFATPPSTRAPADDAGVDAGEAADEGLEAGNETPTACGAAQLACDGGCVAQDTFNCGQCGMTCTAPPQAVATCTVSAGQFACGSACSPGYTSCPGAGCVAFQSDNANCGRCGHTCFGGMCSAGRCGSWQVTDVTPGAELLGGPRAGVFAHAAMATDGKNVAWIDATSGVLEAPLMSGASVAPITLAASPSGSPFGWGQVAMSNGTVVWTTWHPHNSIQLWSSKDNASLGGQVVATVLGSPADVPSGLAIDATGTEVYLMDSANELGAPANPGLYGCVLASKTCTLLHSVAPSPDFAIADDVAVASGVFFTDTSAQAVLRQNLGTLAAGQDSPGLLAVDSTNLYWANIGIPNGGGASTFAIWKSSQTPGGTASTLVPPQSDALWGMATDGVNVYFSSEGSSGGNRGGSLFYVPVTGGTPQSLTDGQAAIAVATGGGAIVWIDANANAINAIAAP
jgi:hypothetical protein